LSEKSAALYDIMYSFKNYDLESERLKNFILRYKRSEGNQLLDVACGTGQHLSRLQTNYEVAGLDIDHDMLTIATQRLPGVPLYQADMMSFDLGRKFDVVTNLFSAIGYVRTLENLNLAAARMTSHLKPGGVLLVEPWFYPEFFIIRPIYNDLVNQPNLKISAQTALEDGVSVLNFRYWIQTVNGIDTFEERHEFGLFTQQEYQAAFETAGLETHYHTIGLNKRGLWIGIKP
jgi:SAM-dependent methyltransferase